ncbi:uncharacterized protein [Typha angustifolia]|uniref:uncharacterized protein n=1 Tax=Typha angustifolia TaxID=59011 RepID=UPI003C2FAAA4
MNISFALSSYSILPLALILLLFCPTLLHSKSAIVVVAAAPTIGNTSNDQQTLLCFKSQLSDPLGALASWKNESLNFCKWRGVTCNRHKPVRVTALNLDSLSLTGLLPSCIANLTFLERIHLPNNQLHGQMPPELGLLSRLQYLNLSMNSLDGEIPTTLSQCSRLEVISLSSNMLMGNIPSSLTQCLKLQTLGLKNNRLEGEIPNSFGSHPNLKTLILTSNNLVGNIPWLLGSSSSLNHIYLDNNRLSGEIPPFLANSSSLQYISLSNNSLTGEIPSAFLNSSSLVGIDLSHNVLTGIIPASAKIITSSLQHLDLSINSLSGGIPPSIGNISSLVTLFLHNNLLEGSIPESLGSIPGLQQLDLSTNNLSGLIPPSVYNISSLTHLGLGTNKLSGVVPPNIGHTLPNIQILIMEGNQFEGPVPPSLSNISGLQMLDLATNSFSGIIPSNLGSLQNLQQLNLGGNQLQAGDWSFLSSLSNCRLLKTLILQSNVLEGSLPNFVGNLSTTLEQLRIGSNQISGMIPAGIGHLVNLTVLFLESNLLTGIIPEAIGNLHNLLYLDLSCNKLSGPVPASIGNLNQLNELYLYDNELNGTIPAILGNCQKLLTLNLSGNALDGGIPKELASLSSLSQGLDLSRNHLSGAIPLEVGSLINLGFLDVSYNKLSGEIPATLGNCLLLEYLHMEGNLLQGKITPQSFGNLRGIKELDLSLNSLSGNIPDFFKSFGSLQYFNLSFNDLEGEMPEGGIFSNATEIFVLGNRGLCGGDPKLHLPPCSLYQSSSSKSRSLILMVTIPVATIALISLSFLFCILCRSRMKDKPNQSACHLEDKYEKVSYADIVKATDGFSLANLLGAGSFGSVYRGKLHAESNTIAVKVFNLHQNGAVKSFTAECEALRNIRHRNLLNVITLCSTADYKGNDFKAIILEYMPNGSLEDWLHPKVQGHNGMGKLNLAQRFNIIMDITSSLCYLHHHCVSPIIHCDLKPSNILLDSTMTARVSDFGLARFLYASGSTTSGNSTSLLGLKGSIGYVAPEYGMGGQISTQGDVYSYGILLLEMLTGKRPTDDVFKDGLSLHKFVAMKFPDKLVEILDPEMLHEEGQEGNTQFEKENNARARMQNCVIPLIQIGLSCSMEAPKDRIKMQDVASEIIAIKGEFLVDKVVRQAHAEDLPV